MYDTALGQQAQKCCNATQMQHCMHIYYSKHLLTSFHITIKYTFLVLLTALCNQTSRDSLWSHVE